ncbi:MAG: PilZ domain-containing protein [Phycisphaerales bacterium]|nr:PilZ domain-containing protein [Phycisphaerales bacterium]
MTENRRRHERLSTPPMYTPIRVRRLESETFDYEGHGYDLSEGGIRFELDTPIDPGTPIAIEITLPLSDRGPGRAVYVLGNVIWADEEDLIGPCRMAMAFTRFVREGDVTRLQAQLRSRALPRAA